MIETTLVSKSMVLIGLSSSNNLLPLIATTNSVNERGKAAAAG